MRYLTSARVAALALYLTGVGVGVSTMGQRPEVVLWMLVGAAVFYLLDKESK